MTQAYAEKENPSFPIRGRTYDLPITTCSSDALPLSYRRLVAAILHTARIGMSICRTVRVKKNVMLHFQPGEKLIIEEFFSQ